MVDLHIRRLDKDLALFDKEAARLGGGGDSPDRAAALAAAMAAAAAGGKPAKSHAKRSGKAGAWLLVFTCWRQPLPLTHTPARGIASRQAAQAGCCRRARWRRRAGRWAC
jgi:hypothetical protein